MQQSTQVVISKTWAIYQIFYHTIISRAIVMWTTKDKAWLCSFFGLNGQSNSNGSISTFKSEQNNCCPLSKHTHMMNKWHKNTIYLFLLAAVRWTLASETKNQMPWYLTLVLWSRMWSMNPREEPDSLVLVLTLHSHLAPFYKIINCDIYKANAPRRLKFTIFLIPSFLIERLYKCSYFSKNSDKKIYPWQDLKSSSRIWETSLESLRKQKTVTNISTNSMGDSSWTRCMFSIHKATHPLPKITKTSHFTYLSTINHLNLLRVIYGTSVNFIQRNKFPF